MVASRFRFLCRSARALVVLCLFPSFAFLFSLVYAATAPTRDGGRSSVPFLKKQVRLRRPFFSKRVDISPHFCYTDYRRVLSGHHLPYDIPHSPSEDVRLDILVGVFGAFYKPL